MTGNFTVYTPTQTYVYPGHNGQHKDCRACAIARHPAGKGRNDEGGNDFPPQTFPV